LNEVIFENKMEMINTLNKSLEYRIFRETKHNKHSSRSHTIYNIILLQKYKNKNDIIMTKLRIVDLAGSEKFNN